MDYELYKIIILASVILLILALIFFVKKALQKMIKNEIYSAFPSIKSEMENLAHRIEHLKSDMGELEGKINARKS
ncbi:MAG: hypothetical protein ABSB18_08390 [Candidatus Omnitrophota bacterium]